MRLFLALSVVAVIAGTGCSKDNSSGPEQNPSDMDYVAMGWSDFEAQRFDSAVNNFTQAYSSQTSTPLVRGEALNGRGWSYAYKRDLVKSSGDFVFAIGLKEISPAALNDVRAGAAFVLYSLNDFSSSITYSNSVLTEVPSYTFAHDAKVTAKRLRLLLVQSYYANGQFSSAASQMDVIDPARAPHSSDPSILLASITAALNSL
ncbi:MAG: hypothetical protein NTZ35_06565 [Ignavibacteriales bacterium]|nr:hypothetical protein [Ignavibacteriales bacterium]